MNFIIGFIILGQALICLSQSASGEGSVELPCGLDQETLDKAKGSLDVGTINLAILRCLCKLKISGSAGGSIDAGGMMGGGGSPNLGGSMGAGRSMGAGDTSVGASASVNVGIDLNIVDCDGVANPDPSKKIDYKVEIRRFYLSNNSDPRYTNSYIFFPDVEDYNGNYTSTIVKKMEKDDCFYFRIGKLTYGSKKYLIDIQKDHSIKQICDEFDEGTDQYNFLKILKNAILGGHDCPIEKDTVSDVTIKFGAIKLATNDPWPCGLMDLTVDLRDKPDSEEWAVLGRWRWNIENDCVEEPEK